VAAGASFDLPTYHGPISGDAPVPAALECYTKLFSTEFTLYPPGLVKRSGLERIVFCSKLCFDGQPRGAIPDFEHNVFYLDVSSGAYDANYQRRVIHHDFYHILDYRDDGQLYQDDAWASLNAATFHYGQGGASAQGMPETSLLTDAYPGFLNHYATTGVEEDKAEIFANLIVNAAAVNRQAATDRVLAAKLTRMKQLLSEFCPEMDDRFWRTAGALDRH
jgi:hypothetical protein